YGLSVSDGLVPTIDLHDAIVAHALAEVFVWCPDANFAYAGISGGEQGCRGQGVVGLELDHGPHHNSHRSERPLQRVELDEKSRINPLACLISIPELVAERFNHVIRRNSEVRRFFSD